MLNWVPNPHHPSTDTCPAAGLLLAHRALLWRFRMSFLPRPQWLRVLPYLLLE